MKSCYVFCILVPHLIFGIRSAVTYEFSGGRLGDNIIAYMHAKWISYKNDIPLLYRPFKYSNQLVFHEVEERYSDVKAKKFKKIVKVINQEVRKKIDSEAGNLYIIPYFAEAEINKIKQRKIRHKHPSFDVDWADVNFHQLIKMLVCPRKSLGCNLPSDKLTVALHMRKGGDFEHIFYGKNKPLKKDDADIGAPEKFASDDFFINELRFLLSLTGNAPLYVYIFTDDNHPGRLVQKLKKALNSPFITFDYRSKGNKHNANVLEDLFAMTQFDCIIRPDSNFSLVASKIGDHLLTISPLRLHWEKGKLIFDENKRIIKPLLFDRIKSLQR